MRDTGSWSLLFCKRSGEGEELSVEFDEKATVLQDFASAGRLFFLRGIETPCQRSHAFSPLAVEPIDTLVKPTEESVSCNGEFAAASVV